MAPRKRKKFLKKSKRKFPSSFRLLKGPSTAIGAMGWKEGTFVLILRKESRISAIIHTFLCKPLHVVWLDSSFRIVDEKFCSPNRIYIPKSKAKVIVESTKRISSSKLKDIIRRLQESSSS